jgi:hypothetical protein
MSDPRRRVSERLALETAARIADDVARWALAGAGGGVVLALVAASGGAPLRARLAGAAFAVVVAAGLGWWRGARRCTPASVAEALERHTPADNLVVTAEALGRGPGHPWHGAVADAAWTRLHGIAVPSRQRACVRLGLAALVAVIGATLARPVPAFDAVSDAAAPPGRSAGDALSRITALMVHVAPPSYLGEAAFETADPTSVDVVGGSAVTLRVRTTAAVVRAARASGPPISAAAVDGVATVAMPALPGGTWLITPGASDDARGGRLLTLRVVDDRPPVVRIVTPDRDRRFARPLSDLRVAIDARDDHALRDVRVRLTRVSGSGENLTFADRDVPATIVRTAPGAWTAEAVLPLAGLGLEDGDLVVYRGVAADARPGAPAVESDALLVEVGPLRAPSDAGGGGEDVDPDRRQAISQQMVIVKTEQLHARTGLAAEARLAEAQGLAVEQRMVRAEFVFLMGGEVEDEEVEAAHAHDLVEGRLANEGQAALLGATRAMSRAEARLVAGDTASALVAEREALRLLQQAFDRRRFLLRPVAERARIDPGRRLAGPAPPGAPPSLPVVAPEARPGWDAVDRAATALAQVRDDANRDPIAAAARVAALDSGDGQATAAAAALVRASTAGARSAALADAMRVVHAAAARRLVTPGIAAGVPGVSGAVADALRRRSR